MDKYIYGGDTETVRGEPNSLQFYSEDIACDDIFFVDSKTARQTFLKWCDRRKAGCIHVVYVHYLQFDLPEFLFGWHHKLITVGGDYDFKAGKWNITGVYGTPTFMKLTHDHTTILIIDSHSFFNESLASAAMRVCPDLPKLKRIAGIGKRRYTSRDSSFVEYAMRDAVIAYHLGKAVEQIITEFDIQQPVSAADMSARIFRRKFLDYTIPQPSRDVIDCALLSYHGGKNNVTVPAGWYEDVSSIDISSAYPGAMHGMPAFSNVKLYRRFTSKTAKSGLQQVPEYGVYFVSGSVKPCDWPSVFSHAFKPLSGDIKRIAMQGFELNEALRSRELQPSKIEGWYYDAERDLQAPALRGFVGHFYHLKETTKHQVLRYLYKLIMNSLYGKFIQTRKRGTSACTDIDAEATVTSSELVAGGMFHPFIASGITAKPRSYLHQIEHQTKALHSATDGIFTQSRKLPRFGKGLGEFAVEVTGGTLLLVRNKCYVLYAAKGPKTQPSRVFRGKHIRKYALHGFQGKVSDLEKLIATNKRKYVVERANRLKESLKGGLVVNDFVKREFQLKIGPLQVYPRTMARRPR